MSDQAVEARRRLGQAIKQQRLRHRMTQRTFCERADVSQQTLVRAEDGEKPVKDRSMWLIERGLGWPPGTADRILAGGDPPDPDSVSLPDSVESSDDLRAELRDVRDLVAALNRKVDLLLGDRDR